jgi:hypothetical protein
MEFQRIILKLAEVWAERGCGLEVGESFDLVMSEVRAERDARRSLPARLRDLQLQVADTTAIRA